MHKETWDKLTNVLTELLSIYKAILILSQEKRKILIAAKARELEQITIKEEMLILQVGRLENLRQKVIAELGALYGLTADDSTLSSLKEVAEEHTARQLDTLAEQFEKVLGELVPMNKLNTNLIRQALVLVNYNINILAQSTSSPTYAPEGQSKREGNSRNWIDRKV